jgi:hypothetical protein
LSLAYFYLLHPGETLVGGFASPELFVERRIPMNVVSVANQNTGFSWPMMKNSQGAQQAFRTQLGFSGQLAPLAKDDYISNMLDEYGDWESFTDADLQAAKEAYQQQQKGLLRTLGYVGVTGGVLALGLLKYLAR